MNIFNKVYQIVKNVVVEQPVKVQDCNYSDDYYGDRVCRISSN